MEPGFWMFTQGLSRSCIFVKERSEKENATIRHLTVSCITVVE